MSGNALASVSQLTLGESCLLHINLRVHQCNRMTDTCSHSRRVKATGTVAPHLRSDADTDATRVVVVATYTRVTLSLRRLVTIIRSSPLRLLPNVSLKRLSTLLRALRTQRRDRGRHVLRVNYLHLGPGRVHLHRITGSVHWASRHEALGLCLLHAAADAAAVAVELAGLRVTFGCGSRRRNSL